MEAAVCSIRRFDSPNAFLEANLNWLLKSGVSNNSLVSAVQAIAAGRPVLGKPHWFASIIQNEFIKGCAIHEQLDGLMTTPLPQGAHELVAASILEDGLEVRKVYGPANDSRKLAQALCENGHRNWFESHRWDCFAADSVSWPKTTANGKLRKTRNEERDTIESWATQYANEKPAPIPVEAFILGKMQADELYVWDDRGPKMMLSVSGRTPLCARISAAFTPREFRGRGYASSAVASLASQLLQQGHSYATLMVEAHERQLQRLYSRLGFEKLDTRIIVTLK